MVWDDEEEDTIKWIRGTIDKAEIAHDGDELLCRVRFQNETYGQTSKWVSANSNPPHLRHLPVRHHTHVVADEAIP
jgi:hypothetical protein